ncbi:ABC-type multidrug transport system ATPase subunit [Clostridium beijerinckii]|uniref:hypothetical protein n=1 Tax=Clostridium beijerinckii TaxID=1520 RepID=UPI001E1578EB|nr:hypothetical protein [Clostridium beijerinckii]NRX27146.1 ABC-type multidrug transport system ATPase subunit [Clostridium beijerinckii]
MNYILKTDNLTKQYGTQLSVSNLCINIEENDIYGFIGRNGAGKNNYFEDDLRIDSCN